MRTSDVYLLISRMFISSPWTMRKSSPVSSLMAVTWAMSLITCFPRISEDSILAMCCGVTANDPTMGLSTLAFSAVIRAMSLVTTSEQSETSE